MSAYGILRYCMRAAAFALPAALLVTACRHIALRKKERTSNAAREVLLILFTLYLAALFAITVVRDGAHLTHWWKMPHSWDSVQLIPLLLTLRQAHDGVWAIAYPVLGNMLWFAPLGFFMGVLRPACRLRHVAFVSLAVSLSIELLQWIVCSGVSDVDDVIFNLCGGLLGYALTRAIKRRKAAPKNDPR